MTGVVFGGISSLIKHWSDKSIRLPSGSENKKYTNAVFDLINALCTYLFQNSILSFENSVVPDQLASSEAS